MVDLWKVVATNSCRIAIFKVMPYLHLLTFFVDNGNLTERQRNYNCHHSAASVTVDICEGLLEEWTRSLLHCLLIKDRLDV
ncbi:hypothetical protein MTP99_006867 [Tenebrio molitor]|nr:hypothetical protein MTP99_006867 [Tenebrio molitor]